MQAIHVEKEFVENEFSKQTRSKRYTQTDILATQQRIPLSPAMLVERQASCQTLQKHLQTIIPVILKCYFMYDLIRQN